MPISKKIFFSLSDFAHMIYRKHIKRRDTLKNSKFLAIGGLCVCLAVLFQIIPVIFSELFVLTTMLSALPIYIISRINPKLGIVALIGAGIIIMSISTHKGLFFLCTNGPVGISLGTADYYFNKKALISLLSGVILTLTLSFMNYIIGIPVLGTSLPGNFIIQLTIIFLFSILYCFTYLHLARYIYNSQ
jgi:phage shock protein PspC (stress-responsive transcriptional regulator)